MEKSAPRFYLRHRASHRQSHALAPSSARLRAAPVFNAITDISMGSFLLGIILSQFSNGLMTIERVNVWDPSTAYFPIACCIPTHSA
jgi:hypothetical protein